MALLETFIAYAHSELQPCIDLGLGFFMFKVCEILVFGFCVNRVCLHKVVNKSWGFVKQLWNYKSQQFYLLELRFQEFKLRINISNLKQKNYFISMPPNTFAEINLHFTYGIQMASFNNCGLSSC